MSASLPSNSSTRASSAAMRASAVPVADPTIEASRSRQPEPQVTQRVRRPPWRSVVVLVVIVVGAALAGCSSTPDGVDAYCAAVAEHADVMASSADLDEIGSSEHRDAVAEKRAAMFELRDVAPAEIRDDWDAWVADGTELAARDVARANVAAFEAEHC